MNRITEAFISRQDPVLQYEPYPSLRSAARILTLFKRMRPKNLAAPEI